MNYRVEEKPSFYITGLKKRVPLQFEGINPEIEAMWTSLTEEEIRYLKNLSDTDPTGLIQASINFDSGRMEEQGELDHYVGVATTEENTGKWSSLAVPATVWAVFQSTGQFPQSLQETWGRIYSEWFPSIDYEISQGPEILSIKDKNLSLPNVRCEIWIPVKKTRPVEQISE